MMLGMETPQLCGVHSCSSPQLFHQKKFVSATMVERSEGLPQGSVLDLRGPVTQTEEMGHMHYRGLWVCAQQCKS